MFRKFILSTQAVMALYLRPIDLRVSTKCTTR